MTRDEKKEAYEIACNKLNVDPEFDKEDIKQSYFKLAKLYHPDKNVSEKESIIKKNTETFVEILVSYNYIKNYREEQGTWI